MKFLKLNNKTFILALLVLLCIAVITCVASSDIIMANASGLETAIASTMNMFGKNISSIRYLYNFDDSADFKLVSFADGGYAILTEGSDILLEYSEDNFALDLSNIHKAYYNGPSSFYSKSGNEFQNLFTNESISLDNEDILQVSSKIRISFSLTTNYNVDENALNIQTMNAIGGTQSVPAYSDDVVINSSNEAVYIDNYRFFNAKPIHGVNNGESCTTIAIQLLLSYNNYYNDRRIIANEYLFGTSESYANRNPNYCSNPLSMTSYTVGSTQGFHDYLYTQNISGYLTVNSATAMAGTCAEIPLKTYLNQRGIDYTMTSYFNSFTQSLSSDIIIREINENRPLVIVTGSYLNGTQNDTDSMDHSVIAYGYQTLSPYENGEEYLGYIVHMGWDNNHVGDRIKVWTNSAWYYDALSLEINHTHNYVLDYDKNEMICDECRHRTIVFNTVENSDGLYVSGMDTSVNTSSNVITIPSLINGTPIVGIESEAFKDCSCIGFIIPESVVKIKSDAFTNNSVLKHVKVDYSGNLVNISDFSTSYQDYYYTEQCLGVELKPYTTYTLTFDYMSFNSSSSRADVFTSLGVGESTFAVDLPVQQAFDDEVYGSRKIMFTPTETQLATSKKLWCRFIRTSTPQTVSIDISNVKLEAGVQTITSSAFSDCPNLASWGLHYTTDESTNTLTVSAGTFDSKILFIPASFYSSDVTKIEIGGFFNGNIRKLFIQEGIETIGAFAFARQRDLVRVEIPDSIIEIQPYAFEDCTNIEDIDISTSSNLVNICQGAFDNCDALESFYVPATVALMGSYAFLNCSHLTSITFASNSALTNIGDYAFRGCDSLLCITIPSSTISIGAYAFDGCSDLIWVKSENAGALATIGEGAFRNCTSLTRVDMNSVLTEIGVLAFINCTGMSSIIVPNSVETIGANAFKDCTNLTIYTEKSNATNNWNSSWNSSNRPVVWSCATSGMPLYVTSTTKSNSNPTNTTSEMVANNPYRASYTFDGWYTNSDFSGTQYNDLASAPNGTLYIKWSEISCVTAGTMITLEDGSQKAVELLNESDRLLVWNLETGTFDGAPILFIDSGNAASYEIIELTFSDGSIVKVVDEHGFFDLTLNKYVFMRSDASQYIGHNFNKQIRDEDNNLSWASVQLTGVRTYSEVTTVWSPVTYSFLCVYVNGMLSMPGATEGLTNTFDIDSATMKYDENAMANDIATYGLFTYAEFANIIPVSEYVFEAINGKYLKVAMGKGLIGIEDLLVLADRYLEFM